MKRVENTFSLKSEVEEGFLHSGTAKSAVPPVGMTSFWVVEEMEKTISAKLTLLHSGTAKSAVPPVGMTIFG